jgi:flagellar biosynthesis GTPase FlhF
MEGALTFNPLNPRPEKSLLLVGPPGSGKTTAVAKIATLPVGQEGSARSRGRRFRFVRAGQLGSRL